MIKILILKLCEGSGHICVELIVIQLTAWVKFPLPAKKGSGVYTVTSNRGMMTNEQILSMLFVFSDMLCLRYLELINLVNTLSVEKTSLHSEKGNIINENSNSET